MTGSIETKPCDVCKGMNVCVECEGEGFVDCNCPDCGDLHTASCTECNGLGECPDCEGGMVPLTDRDRERAGQLAIPDVGP